MAQALEAEADIEMILGLGANEPRVPLERTEFVRSDQKYSILSRIVRATQVDTIVHTFLETNSVNVSARALHEINVIGTLNLLAAAGSAGSSVRQVVVKSSTHVYGSAETDPAWFREEDSRQSPVRTRVERSLIEVESLVRDFAEDNPHLVVSVLRFANVLGHRHHHPGELQPAPPAAAVHRRLRPAGPVHRRGRRGPGPRIRDQPPGPRGVQRGRRGQAAVERGGVDLQRLPAAPAAVSATGLRGPVAPDRGRPVPTGGGGPDPLWPWCRHLPPDREPGSSTATPVPVPWRASPGPTTCAGPPARASRSTATSRTSSSSSATPPPWCAASTAERGSSVLQPLTRGSGWPRR